MVINEHIEDPSKGQFAVRRPRIYLAGPDVFFSNACAVFEDLKRICSCHGLEGVSPFDGDVGQLTGIDQGMKARKIRDANMGLIYSCDGILANLMPFRGLEPDSGTVFETAVGVVLGKTVVAYSNVHGTLEERVTKECGSIRRDNIAYDQKWGFMIEEFGLRQNLMLSCSYDILDCAQDAIALLAQKLSASNAASRGK